MVVDIYKKYISYVNGKRNNTLEEFLDNKELFFNAYFSYAITTSSSQFNTIDNLFMIDVMEEEIIKRIKNSDKNIINKVISMYSSLYKEEPILIVSSRIYRECLDIFPDNIVKSINKTNNNFKDLIDKKYRNNYIFNTTTQNSDIFCKYFHLEKYDEEIILKELELETDPLAILIEKK